MKSAAGTGPANQALAIEGGYDYSFVEGTGHLLQVEKTFSDWFRTIQARV
jgi:hypothetical protein